MFKDTIAKLSDSAAGKAAFLERNPLGYLIASVMAGAYIGLGILLIFSLGSLLDPAVRPLAMGAAFGLALILVVFAGAELYTSLTMTMMLGRLTGAVSSRQMARVWALSWVGNLLGALALSAIFVEGGGGVITHAASEFIYKAAETKMHAGAAELVARAMLCNWLVCLAIWMASRIASETARMIAIAWCLFAFIAPGYEHSIANMTVFGVVLLSPHPEGLNWVGAAWNLGWVTLGNTLAGALFMGFLPWLASRDWGLPEAAALSALREEQ